MSVIQAIILGIVQGITEFLPISSTGHLIIVPALFHWQPHSLAFDTTLHLGTLLALTLFFLRDLVSIMRTFVTDIVKKGLHVKEYHSESLMGIYLLVGSLPAALLGLFVGDFVEAVFRQTYWVAIFLLLGSILMLLAERVSKGVQDTPSLGGSFLIGIFQALALLPGISRSGATISGAMLLGLPREKAARWSFLLSIPVVLGAGVVKLGDLVLAEPGSLITLALGFLASAFAGYLAIRFLLKFFQTNKLYIFIVYRLVLAGLLFFASV